MKVWLEWICAQMQTLAWSMGFNEGKNYVYRSAYHACLCRTWVTFGALKPEILLPWFSISEWSLSQMRNWYNLFFVDVVLTDGIVTNHMSKILQVDMWSWTHRGQQPGRWEAREGCSPGGRLLWCGRKLWLLRCEEAAAAGGCRSWLAPTKRRLQNTVNVWPGED